MSLSKPTAIFAVAITMSYTGCMSTTTTTVQMDELGQSDDNVAIIESLAENPAESVRTLIEQLHVIPDQKILVDEQHQYQDAMRVIWSIRGLRYLTGIDFQAPTSHKFVGVEEENRARFLSLTDSGEVSFFGVRMSRDTTYPAPPDAQRQIIDKWKEWLRESAPTFEFPEPMRFSDWYF